MPYKDLIISMNETKNLIFNFIGNIFSFGWVKAFIGFIGGIVSYMFGGMSMTIHVLIALIILDILSGVLVAIRNKRLSSHSFCRGCWKLFSYLLVIVAVRLMEIGVMDNITFFTTMVISMLIVTEALSIFENGVLLGVPVPKYLINFIAHSEKYKKKKKRYRD